MHAMIVDVNCLLTNESRRRHADNGSSKNPRNNKIMEICTRKIVSTLIHNIRLDRYRTILSD